MAATPLAIDKDAVSYRGILRYALPLVLSNSGGMVMQFTDRMFLAWHSPASVAGAGTAGIIAICFVGLFSGVTGFTNVFAAQYLGAGRLKRLGPVVWQGWYLSLAFGLITLALAGFSSPLFDWIGHGAAVRAAEIEYFGAYMSGGFVFMATSALLGFFIGRGDTGVVMKVHLTGIALNIVLDYAMIFGKWGMPAFGVAGAAWATVLSQALMLAIGIALFWLPRHRAAYDTGAGWRPEARLCLRIIRYGAPSGLRVVIDLMLWSVFLGLIGLLGDNELAASNVAFTINSLAWQPMIGFGMAVSMLVGQAQGADRPDWSRLAMRRGLILTQCWMMFAAMMFVLIPNFFLQFFFADAPAGQHEALMHLGRTLLLFVAVYCLLDGMNVVLAMGLTGAGDSWWIFRATCLTCLAVIAVLFGLWRLEGGLYGYWTVATVYVGFSGMLWVWRYCSKTWERMRVVEPIVVEESGPEKIPG